MYVIGHDHEFMEQKFPLLPIMRQRVHEQTGCGFAAKDGEPASRDGGYKENAIGVHGAMVIALPERSL